MAIGAGGKVRLHFGGVQGFLIKGNEMERAQPGPVIGDFIG